MSKVYTGNGLKNVRINGKPLQHQGGPFGAPVYNRAYEILLDCLGIENYELAQELTLQFRHDILLPRLDGEWVLTQDEIEQYLGKVSGPMIAHPTETPPANPTPWYWDAHEVDQDGLYTALFAWNGFTAAYAQNETDDWRAAIQADKDAAAQFEAQII